MTTNKHVIIWLPNGHEIQYCTKDLSDSHIQPCDRIACDDTSVTIFYKEDGKDAIKMYQRMPFILETFQSDK